MSAYVVEDKVIRYIIAAAIKYNAYVKVPKIEGRGDQGYKEVRKFEADELNALGQILLDQNYRSVNARYRKQDKSYKFVFGRSKTDRSAGFNNIDLAQVFKSIANYEYQASETDDFESTEAYDITSRLVRAAGASLDIKDSRENSRLIWGAPDPDPVPLKPSVIAKVPGLSIVSAN